MILTLEICQEDTLKQAFWKSSYWGFLGRQENVLKNKNECKRDK